MELISCTHSLQPVLEDANNLVPGVGREVEELGLTVGPRLETGQDPIRQIQRIRNPCNNRSPLVWCRYWRLHLTKYYQYKYIKYEHNLFTV